MLSVRQDQLKPGEPLPHALYTRAGRLLAHSGTLLSPEMAAFLAQHPTAELRFDTRAEPVGVRPEPDNQAANLIPDPDADRATWERRLLRTRAELRRAAAPLVQVARVRWERLPLNVEIGVDPVPISRAPIHDPHAAPPADIPGEHEALLREIRSAGVQTIHDCFAALLDGDAIDSSPFYSIADEFITALVLHADLYSIPAMGLPRPNDSLPEHAFSTGALALGIAAQLGWPRADVRNAAVSGFLADSGIGLVPYPVRTVGRPLTDVELNSVRRHPEYSIALLRNIRKLPESIVLAVYQHQERGDSSGYPLGISASKIHDLAKVVAVADAFAGMTAPRAHRPALTPHAAMSELAQQAAAGVFDRAVVAALVDLLGLYPARSFVRLSSGHVALVGAAATPPATDRPTVHVVQPAGAPTRFGKPIDLSRIEPKMLRIVEAIRAPENVAV